MIHCWEFPLLDLLCQIFFRRRIQKWSDEFSLTGNFHVSCWDFPSARSSRRYLLFSPCCWYSPARLVTFFLGSSCFVLPYFLTGIQSSWKDWFALVIGVPGSLIHAYCFHRLVTEKVSTGLFPSIWWYFCSSYIIHRTWII